MSVAAVCNPVWQTGLFLSVIRASEPSSTAANAIERQRAIMNDKTAMFLHPAVGTGTGHRLLSIANLALSEDSDDRKVIAWFYETPQVFELSLQLLDNEHDTNNKSFYKMLQEAKAKELPVNIHSSLKLDTNMIDLVIPATKEQIDQYKKEQNLKQKAVEVPPPP